MAESPLDGATASRRGLRMGEILRRQPQACLVAEAVGLVLGIGFLDFASGYEVSIFLFYSVPILLMVWFADRNSAILTALLSGIVWWWADHNAGHLYITNWHQVWEALVRLGFFLLTVVGGSAIKARLQLLERSRRLEYEILRISEREQQRIGQDLHDGLCQYYAAVGCAAGSLKRRLEAADSPHVKNAAEIADLIMEGVVQTRSLARGLFPVENDEGGLQSALQELASNSSRLLNVHCSFAANKTIPVYDNSKATHLFRIAQEALHNAFKHGKASTVIIRFDVADEHTIMLSIADNGSGFPTSSGSAHQSGMRQGMGLKIMEYRARKIGGTLAIAPNFEGGATVSCTFRQ